jgi:hypothetical protein
MKHCPLCDLDIEDLTAHVKTPAHQHAVDESGGFGLPNASTFSRENQPCGRKAESARKPSLDDYDRRFPVSPGVQPAAHGCRNRGGPHRD